MEIKKQKRGRKAKYDFKSMTVGGPPLTGSYTIVSCAINWCFYHSLDWKFRSERKGNIVKLYRVK